MPRQNPFQPFPPTRTAVSDHCVSDYCLEAGSAESLRAAPTRVPRALTARKRSTLHRCASWVACVALIGGTLQHSTAAWAESNGAQKETARSLMDEADRLVAARDLEGALKRYQAAHELMRVPTTGIEVARTYAALGKLVEGRATAIEVVNMPVSASEPAVFAEARANAAQLEAALAARVPSVTIQVKPAEARPVVQIDAITVPAAALGLPFKVNPGEHQLHVEAQGFVAQDRTFKIAEAEQQPLEVVLERSAAPVVANASLGTAAGQPSTPADAPPAAVDDAGDAAFTRAIVAFSVAGVGLGVGAVSGILTLNKVKDAKQYCDGNRCDPQAQSRIDSAGTTALIANIGFGVGVAALGWGLIEWFVNVPSKPKEATASLPRVDVSTGRDAWLVNVAGEF